MDIKKLEDFVEKVDSMKKDNKLDLSSDQDLSLAVMNLISIEEHFFFTGAKLDKPEYYNFLKEAREMRKELMERLIKNKEGETWCLSKHLLSASMRLMEVGTKEMGRDNKELAEDLFKKSYHLYSMFWGLNLGVIGGKDLKKIDDEAMDKHDEEKHGFAGKLGGLVKKAINCCFE